jgi:hypothetical protein
MVRTLLIFEGAQMHVEDFVSNISHLTSQGIMAQKALPVRVSDMRLRLWSA